MLEYTIYDMYESREIYDTTLPPVGCAAVTPLTVVIYVDA
jgi:hypothetical protein